MNFAKRDDYILGAVFLALVALLQWKWCECSPAARQGAWGRALALLGAAALCLGLLPNSYDEISCFAQSAYRYYFPPRPLFQLPNPKEPFPYLAEVVNAPKSDPPQNVFLIMIESFNANFVQKKTPEGQEYTPFFNQLIGQGLFFDNFWGQSMQTVKGLSLIHI